MADQKENSFGILRNVKAEQKRFAVYLDPKHDMYDTDMTGTNESGIPGLDLVVEHVKHNELNSTPNGNSSGPNPSSTGTPRSHATNVLLSNGLKRNATPRSSSFLVDKSSPLEPASGQKRRLHDEDAEKPRKSPKLQHSSTRSRRGLTAVREDDSPITIGAHGEPPPSGISARPSKFQEGSMNDRVSKIPPAAMIGVDSVQDDPMDIDAKPVEHPYSTFNGGDVSTPRPSDIYTFNSTAKSWNPFRMLGNFFGRPSSSASPIKQEKIAPNSGEIADQIEAHLQRFEDRIIHRLVSLQTGGSQPTLDLFQPSAEHLPRFSVEQEHDDRVERLNDSPLLYSGQNTALNSSPLLGIPGQESVALHSTHLHQLVPNGAKGPSQRFGSILRSPGKGRQSLRSSITPSKTMTVRFSQMMQESPRGNDMAADNQNDEHSHLNRSSASLQVPDGMQMPAGIDSKELPELPRLRNKASQQLKKMASKMTLRGRKSRIEDSSLTKNQEYRVMKKKNKEEILKDYMVLQREKQELEKRLLDELMVRESDTADKSLVPTVSSSEEQIQQTTETIMAPPLLLASTTPDFGIKQEKSELSGPQGEEQTRSKRPTTIVPRAVSLNSSPLKLIDEDDNEHELDIDASPKKSEPSSYTNVDDKTVLPAQDKDKETTAILADLRSSVTRQSKVPKSTRTMRSKTKQQEWKGWDEDVF